MKLDTLIQKHPYELCAILAEILDDIFNSSQTSMIKNDTLTNMIQGCSPYFTNQQVATDLKSYFISE